MRRGTTPLSIGRVVLSGVISRGAALVALARTLVLALAVCAGGPPGQQQHRSPFHCRGPQASLESRFDWAPNKLPLVILYSC